MVADVTPKEFECQPIPRCYVGSRSVVVQRGTNHAWANRSGRPCRMLFVLVDGTYDPAIADTLAGR
jgi:hypothetical protein